VSVFEVDAMGLVTEWVSVNLTRDLIKAAPPYTMQTQLDRIEEETLYKHYTREGYWERRSDNR
jgi:hypothetical protein